jgi:hypothetical protein
MLLGVHKYLANFRSSKPKGRAVPSAAMGLCLAGHHPIHSRGGYSNGPGLLAFLDSDAVLSTTRPYL